MAGVGFALRRLAQQDTLTAGVRAYAHAAVISSGPWLLTILSLGGVSLIGRGLLDAEVLHCFSLVVIYNFAFSLVTTGPIVMVVTRRLADMIHAREAAEAPGMFLGALAVVFALQLAIGLPFYGIAVTLPWAERALAVVGFQLVGGIWLAAAFLSALKSYGAVSASFAVGMGCAFLGATQLALAYGMLGMLAGFTAGLCVLLFSLAARILAEFPGPALRPFAFLGDIGRYWEFALVGLLYNAAIWVDKWIMWLGPGQLTTAGAMPSNPAYDGAMFLAFLTIVPAMAVFLLAVETRFFERYLRFYRAIEEHATFAEIVENHRGILRELGAGLRNLAVLQGVVCYLAILVAPGLVDMARGGSEMVSIFRFGALGAMFHMLLLAVMVVVAYFDVRRLLLSIAAVFLILNGGLTLVTLQLGLGYGGYGYCVAALLTLVFAYTATASHILRLPYMTFIGNNRGLR